MNGFLSLFWHHEIIARVRVGIGEVCQAAAQIKLRLWLVHVGAWASGLARLLSDLPSIGFLMGLLVPPLRGGRDG